MAVSEYTIPENPHQTDYKKISNELLYQDYLQRYFEWNDWTVVREVRPGQTEYRADLLVEHDDLGWFGIETKYTNRGGRKMAEAHHQIVTKYRAQMYFGHRINRWIYAPFYEFLEHDSYKNWMNEEYLMKITQDFFQRNGIGYLNPIDMTIKFERGNGETYIGIDRHHRYEPDIDEIDRVVNTRMEQYPY